MKEIFKTIGTFLLGLIVLPLMPFFVLSLLLIGTIHMAGVAVIDAWYNGFKPTPTRSGRPILK